MLQIGHISSAPPSPDGLRLQTRAHGLKGKGQAVGASFHGAPGLDDFGLLGRGLRLIQAGMRLASRLRGLKVRLLGVTFQT
jgi:hypothetical protein